MDARQPVQRRRAHDLYFDCPCRSVSGIRFLFTIGFSMVTLRALHSNRQTRAAPSVLEPISEFCASNSGATKGE